MEKMRRSILIVLTMCLTVAIVFFLFFSFVRWSLDVGSWSEETRLGYAIIVIVFLSLTIAYWLV